MKIPNKLLAALQKEQTFLLATHINPDGDALGSCLALAEALSSRGKRVFIYDRDEVPAQYRFMPGWRKCRSDLGRIPEYDPMLILLDCNSPERADLQSRDFRRTAVIDHHATESAFGEIRWVEKTAAATGVMVFQLIRALHVRLTKSMATNLYTAIAVDTGTFRYSNTGAQVLNIGATLVEAGAKPHKIAESLYETWTKNRFDLLMRSLHTFDMNDGIALLHVTREMMKQTGTVEADTENIANFPRMVDSIKISALIREVEDGRWKVSMRSKGSANVGRIAEAYGGGGHRNAAGFRIKAELEGIKKAIFESGRKELRKG